METITRSEPVAHAVGIPVERMVMAWCRSVRLVTNKGKIMSNNCTICGAPHNGSGVGTGNGGLAHRWCYAKEHPPTQAQTLHQMARGHGDPVLAAQVIAEWVPHELASQIVDDFNARLMKQWRRRCEP